MEPNKKRTQNRLMSKFIKVFLIAFAVLFLSVGLCTAAYIFISGNGPTTFFSKNPDTSGGDTQNGDQDNGLEKITTFALFGVDREGYRTDVIMLAFFNSETMEMNLVSIPRDTMVTIPDDLYEEISKTRSVNQTIKVNEIPAYVEKTDRNAASVEILEKNLNIDIDYYASIDIEGFKTIVDLVGPIPVEIPFPMYYVDEAQDLYINLDEGLQELNGEQAEMLIRFRKGYANGDLGRIDMQHEFMKAFMTRLLSNENRMNIVNIATTALLYVETDFDTAIDYVNYIDDISLDKLNIQTIPGEAKMLDRSYYVFDATATDVLLQQLSTGETGTPSEDVEQIYPADLVDVRTLGISVQNGTDIKGLAGKNMDRLLEDGFNVLEAVDYDQETVTTTKLIVPSEKVGEVLSAYFNNPEIQVDTTLFDQERQVLIILGESDGE